MKLVIDRLLGFVGTERRGQVYTDTYPGDDHETDSRQSDLERCGHLRHPK